MENLENLTGKCPTCFEETEFEYVGEQENIDDKPPIILYNCLNCFSAINVNSIINSSRGYCNLVILN